MYLSTKKEKAAETGTTLGSHNQARVVFTQQVPTLCYRLCSRHSVGRVLGKHSWEHNKAASTNADGDVAKAMSLGVKISVAFWVWKSRKFTKIFALLIWL